MGWITLLLWSAVAAFAADSEVPVYVVLEGTTDPTPQPATLATNDDGRRVLRFQADGASVTSPLPVGEADMVELISSRYFRPPVPVVGVQNALGPVRFGEAVGMVYRARASDTGWSVDPVVKIDEREILVKLPGKSEPTVRKLTTVVPRTSLVAERNIPGVLKNDVPVRIVNWARAPDTGAPVAIAEDARPSAKAAAAPAPAPPEPTPAPNYLKVFGRSTRGRAPTRPRSVSPSPAERPAAPPPPPPASYLVPLSDVAPISPDKFVELVDGYNAVRGMRPRDPFRAYAPVDTGNESAPPVRRFSIVRDDGESVSPDVRCPRIFDALRRFDAAGRTRAVLPF